MKKIQSRPGIAIPVVLMMITLCVVLVTAVASSGLSTLFYTGIDRESKQSLYAAEAGIAQAIRQVVDGTSGWNGFTDVKYGENSTFTVQCYKGPAATPVIIPAGCCYLLATGQTKGKYPRKVGVLITTGPAGSVSTFPFTVAAGKDIDMQGGGEVHGCLKSGEDLHLKGGIRVRPDGDGDGRMMAGRDLDLGGGIKWDNTQEMRAGRQIDVGSSRQARDAVNGVFPNDTAPEAQPFIADGRFTNTLNTGETGYIIPNPDPTKLLGLVSDGAGGYQTDLVTGLYVIDPTRTDVVQHPETTIAGTLNLADKIHFFPNGIDISGDLSGKGTVVAGSGQNVKISKCGSKSTPQEVNVLALSWPKAPGQGDIELDTNCHLRGLILAHRTVTTKGNCSVKGCMISYKDDVKSQGNRDIDKDDCGFRLPGLESWRCGGGSPPGPGTGTGLPPGVPVKVISWQRL